MMVRLFFFFFSSTRRHTRFDCDWSSDVCSSDLLALARLAGHGPREVVDDEFEVRVLLQHRLHEGRATRSEERRVGKECRSRWAPYQQKIILCSHDKSVMTTMLRLIQLKSVR